MQNHKQIIVNILHGNYRTNIMQDNDSELSNGHAVENNNEYVTVS